MQTNYLEYTPPPSYPEPVGTSRMGIGSFIAAVISLFMGCAFFGLAYAIGNNNVPESNTSSLILLCMLGLVVIACLAGVGLGITSLVQKEANKAFAILGLVFSVAIGIGMCCLIVFSVMLATNY